MATTRQLVDRHGVGITVQDASTQWPPFKILEDKGKHLVVEYQDGHHGEILADCQTCADYEVVTDPKVNSDGRKE